MSQTPGKSNKETNLAYGGQALIEGVLMRGKDGYAYTVKQPDETFYKHKKDYKSIGARIRFFGLPFVRGVAGLFENMRLGTKIINRSAEIAFPEEAEKETTIWHKIASYLIMILSMGVIISIFLLVPRFLPKLTPFTPESDPFVYNLISAVIRLVMFFGYLLFISVFKDARRLFGYHGAEHKTIHAYENDLPLTVENVSSQTRLHPRCGTSFMFIVFLITIIVFPFFDILMERMTWFAELGTKYGRIGDITKNIIIIVLHVFVGMPIVSSISYELLKISARFQRNPVFKVFIAPGLFFQLFTTREPDEGMIKAAIISLKMVTGEEDPDTKRSLQDSVTGKPVNTVLTTLMSLLRIII
jgi:uncharacterized protein YqhQ